MMDSTHRHRGGNLLEVTRPDLEQPPPEREAPTLLVANELQRFDEWMDRRFRARFESHAPSPRMKVGRRLDLKRLVIDDRPDGGEMLERLAVRIVGAR